MTVANNILSFSTFLEWTQLFNLKFSATLLRPESSVTFLSFQYSPEIKNRNRFNGGPGKYQENSVDSVKPASISVLSYRE